MVSSNKVDFDLRERGPRSRNILHSCKDIRDRERAFWILLGFKGYRSWILAVTSLKVSTDYLTYPVDVRDSAKSGLGQIDNHHLNYLVESISVNVGGLLAEVSSPPMKQASVGGPIVVRGWESQPQGEGGQFAGIPMQMVTECQHEGGSSCECR